MAKDKKEVVDKSVKDLDTLIKNLEKSHGAGSVQLGQNFKGTNIERWNISSPLISHILGGGLPKGRIIEIWGPESAGKTSLATYLAGEVQKQGGIASYIDAEYSAELEHAEATGLNRDSLLFTQPDYGEQALQIAQDEVESGLVDIIIIDSVSALTPLAEINGEMSDQQMGEQARMMGKGMRKLAAVCGKTKTTIIFINQIRMKIGVMYGNPETTSGGNALKFYASIRLEVRKVEFLAKGNDPPFGLLTRVTAKKNKTAPPYRKGEVKLIFGKGFQYQEEYIDFAVKYDIIEKSASWYTLFPNGAEGEKVQLQGKEKVVEYFKEHLELYEKLVERVKVAMNPPEVVEEVPAPRKPAKKNVEKEVNKDGPNDKT